MGERGTLSSQLMQENKKKTFDITHSFMVKTLNKVGKKENFLNIIKGVYNKPTSNMTLKV